MQVFAGRDRGAAAGLVEKLGNAGYDARMLTVPEGQGALYKVRVDGYPTRNRALGGQLSMLPAEIE